MNPEAFLVLHNTERLPIKEEMGEIEQPNFQYFLGENTNSDTFDFDFTDAQYFLGENTNSDTFDFDFTDEFVWLASSDVEDLEEQTNKLEKEQRNAEAFSLHSSLLRYGTFNASATHYDTTSLTLISKNKLLF